MAKVLSLRLKQCFSPFTMLPVEGSSETGLIYIHIYIYIYIYIYYIRLFYTSKGKFKHVTRLILCQLKTLVKTHTMK